MINPKLAMMLMWVAKEGIFFLSLSSLMWRMFDGRQ